MAMRSLGYMPSEVELAIIMQRLDMDGERGAAGARRPPDEPRLLSGALALKGLALAISRLGVMSWFTVEVAWPVKATRDPSGSLPPLAHSFLGMERARRDTPPFTRGDSVAFSVFT